MRQRLWIPVAVVLVALLIGTVIAGVFLRDRLEGAAAVLEPVVEPSLADTIVDSDELGVPICDDAGDVLGEVRAFHVAVAEAQAEARADGSPVPELTSTAATFDSFLLETATARTAAGTRSLVVRARPDGSGGWCVVEAEFSTEG